MNKRSTDSTAGMVKSSELVLVPEISIDCLGCFEIFVIVHCLSEDDDDIEFLLAVRDHNAYESNGNFDRECNTKK